MQHSIHRFTTRRLVTMALMAAISSALMFLETPLPLMPPFLKLDISAVPVMVTSFMFGPVEGIMIAALKACINLLTSSSAGVGQLADFLVTGAFALTAGLVYGKNRNLKGAIAASIASIFVITAVAVAANYYILLPFYAEAFMPYEAIFSLCQSINPRITNLTGYIIWGVIPFNLFKGTVIAAMTFLVYKRMAGFIRKYTDNNTPLHSRPATSKQS